jgi:hypoxanthine phosphoribosyltransferase
MHLSVGSESVSRDSSLSLLIPADKLQVRIREMGAEITRDYAGRQVSLVGLFGSSQVFLRDLVRATELRLAVDSIASDSRGDGASTPRSQYHQRPECAGRRTRDDSGGCAA